MRSFVCRPLMLAFLATLFFSAPTAAQPEPDPAVWQGVITHQIQAFRDQDALAAFSDAGIMFQSAFPSAEAFFVAIIGGGYAPIMESRSHSFGEYRVAGDDGVLQVVRLVGKKQEIYEAVYQLKEEEGIWRVQGVVLRKSAGIGV